MAKAKRKRFGDSAEVHAERSKSTLREMKRLRGALLRHLRSPPDCATAALLAITLAEQSGAYLIDRSAGLSRAGFGGRGIRGVLNRFVSACVVKPRSEAHKRKIHAVWR